MTTESDARTDEFLFDAFEFFLNDVTRDALGEMRFYLSTMEGYVAAQLSSAMAILNSESERITSTRRDDFIMDNYPFDWEDVVASQLRQSFVMSAVSFAQHHVGMATHLIRGGDADARLDGNLERNRAALEAAGFARPTESQWQALFGVRDIRDCIVHCNGWIEESRKSRRVLELVSKSPDLSESSGTLGMSSEYPVRVLGVVGELVTTVYEEGMRLHAPRSD